LLGLLQELSSGGVLAAGWAPYWHFSGVFHPAVSHFPIALLTVAALVESWSVLRRHRRPSQTTLVCLYLGTAGAIVATLLGWANADGSERRGDIIFVHRWLGVALAIVAVGAVVLSLFARRERTTRQVMWSYRGSVLTAGALVGLTGMYGGKLSFGKDYYANAYAELQRELKEGGEKETPKFALAKAASATKPVINSTTQPIPNGLAVVDGNILVSPGATPTTAPTTAPVLATATAGLGGGTIDYSRDIAPIFLAQCDKCHNADKDKGDYRMDTKELLFTAGESGKLPIIPGKSDESLLVLLIEGKGEHEDSIMPPKGDPLTFQEIALIRRWIDEGAQALP
jgi:uncharacterized membrane protein